MAVQGRCFCCAVEFVIRIINKKNTKSASIVANCYEIIIDHAEDTISRLFIGEVFLNEFRNHFISVFSNKYVMFRSGVTGKLINQIKL